MVDIDALDKIHQLFLAQENKFAQTHDYGYRPNTVFLGREEYQELRDILREPNLKISLCVYGMDIQKIDEDSFLAVGRVVEWQDKN